MKPAVIKCFIICLITLTVIASISVLAFVRMNHQFFTTPMTLWIIFIDIVGVGGAAWACGVTLADDATMDEMGELDDLETDGISRDQTAEQVV